MTKLRALLCSKYKLDPVMNQQVASKLPVLLAMPACALQSCKRAACQFWLAQNQARRTGKAPASELQHTGRPLCIRPGAMLALHLQAA